MILHVTNGGVAAALLREAGLAGEVLAWDDVLHEGPVPAGLSLEELSRERARYLASWPWLPDAAGVADRFVARDAALRDARGADEIVLWFDHDLYGQLQLVQLLHWFEMRREHARRLSLVCLGAHPEVERFTGLGQLSPRQLAALFPGRVPVAAGHLEPGRLAWEAFTSVTPTRIEDVARDEFAALPFLRAALRRHLEQFPATDDGLGRSERQALQAVADGSRSLGDTFRASQQDAEARPFMGDLAFLVHVAALAAGPRPLVRIEHPLGLAPGDEPASTPGYWSREVVATDDGLAVLRGGVDRTELQDVDRWLGGVRLRGTPVPWRFDRHARRLVAPAS